MKIAVSGGNPEEVVKQAFWLAWQACGSPVNMGWLQNQPTATKEDVWHNIQIRGDYAGVDMPKQGEAYADYVFGRMMKLGIEWDTDSITVKDGEPRRDYQAWYRLYPTYASLIMAAMESIPTEAKA